MSSMLKAAIGHAFVRNISDELDRGKLDILVTPGDLVFVQGSYHFTDIPDGSGADMVRRRRSVNKVEITFVFDRNEGTSGSARTEWLLGVRSLGCLLRANKLERDIKGILHIEATVLAIRSAHEELKTRSGTIPNLMTMNEDSRSGDTLSGESPPSMPLSYSDHEMSGIIEPNRGGDMPLG